MWDWAPVDSKLGGAPALGTDGTIYVNSFKPPTLYAIRPDGTLKWSYQASDCCSEDVPSSPAIGRDGTIYVGEEVAVGRTTEGIVLALNPDGSLRWQSHLGYSPTAISVGGDGTIYFGSGSGLLVSVFALNPDGSLNWEYDEPDGGYVRTSPAIGRGQRVYAGSDEAFFAIGP